MSQQKTQTTAKNLIWNINLRPRVGDSVSFNGSDWSNLTGRNSEPGTDSNWKQIGGGGSGGGSLEAVDDGNGLGYRLKELDTVNRNNIGLNSVDLSSNSAGTGPTTNNSLNVGYENIITKSGGKGFGADYVFGGANEVNSFFNGFALGVFNKINSGYSVYLLGYNNIGNTNNNVGGAAAIGIFNELSGYHVYVLGNGLISKTKGTVVVGEGNTDYTTTGVKDPERPMFVVGIGYLSELASNFGTVTERKDGLIVRKSGRVEAPELTIDLINSSVPKSLVTKEWVQSNAGSRIRKIVEFDTVGFPLSRDIGLEILSENDINSDQYYKIHSIDFRIAPDSTTPGPSGFNFVNKINYRWGTSTLQKTLPAAEIEADSDEAPNDVGSISIRRALFKSTRIIRGQGIYLGSDATLPITGKGRAITTIDYEIIDLAATPVPGLGLRILENNPAGLSQGASSETITVRATMFGSTGSSSFIATDSNNFIVINLLPGDTTVDVPLVLDAQGNFLLNYNLTGLEATAFVSIEIIARSETNLVFPVFPNNIIELSNQ